MNATDANGNVWSCVADSGNALVVEFSYSHRRIIRYLIDQSGCVAVYSRLGVVGTVANDMKLVRRMAALARPAPYGSVDGRVQLCGGPAPGRCRGGVATFCDGAGDAHCWKEDRVELTAPDGRVVDRARVVTWAHAPKWHFTLYARPGRYRVVLLARHTRAPHRLRRTISVPVTLHAGRTVRPTLTVEIK